MLLNNQQKKGFLPWGNKTKKNCITEKEFDDQRLHTWFKSDPKKTELPH